MTLSSNLFYALLLACISVCLLPKVTAGKCGINEVYTDGTACPPICDEPPPDVCIAVLITGCFCKPGFIRRTRGGECIPENLCLNRPGRCLANEEYQKCGTLCPPTCQEQDPEICPDLCVKGCFCKSGFIRKEKGGPCIRKHSCSHHHTTCHVNNEEYNSCGSACPAICDPIVGPIYRRCAAVCVKGCFCKNGYIRTKGGSCIPESLCGPKKVTCHHLPNEEYKACESSCPGFCDPIRGPVYPLCAAFCVKGCFCKEGFIRIKGGPCIPLSLCGPRKGDFCPTTSNQICIRASNKCCSSADCPNLQLCCSENCGNTCKDPVKHKTSGTIVTANENCKIDAV